MSETPDYTPPTADTAGPPTPEVPAEHGFFSSIRRADMARPAERWVGGVSGAVARRLGIDPLVVRALFVASVFFAGIGLVLYGIGWALLPEESDGRIHAQELGRGNTDVALLGAAGFVLAGLVAGDGRWTLAGWWNAAGLGWINGLLWLAVVGVVVAIVVSGARMSGPRAPVPGAAPPPPAPAYRPPAATAAPFSSESPMTGTATPPPPAPQYAYGPPHAPTPPPPPVPPRPSTPPVPGAGARFFAVCAGLSILALAGLLLAERVGIFTGPMVLTTLGITAVVFGLGIIVAGLRGRSSGVLGFIAVMSIILSFPAAVAADTDFGPWRSVDRWDGVGSTSYAPTTIAETTGGFAVGLGDLTVDLTGLDVPTGETVELAIQAGTGSVEVVLPADEAARIALNVGAGEATWDIDGADGSTSGLGVRRTITNEAATSDEDPTFDLQINVGLGNIDITQEG